MPRPRRVDKGGIVYHVLNRGNARAQIFMDDIDYEMFEHLLWEGRERVDMRILAYCLMPNHWHLVLQPREDGDLSKFMFWLGLTHAVRWHARYETAGRGHLYQGRYKSFPVQADGHFFSVCRYVERNPVRAGLVHRAEDWRWSSLWLRANGQALNFLSQWPLETSLNWIDWVNVEQSRIELEQLQKSVTRSRPYGGPIWQERTARIYGQESTLQPRGRPPKHPKDANKKGS